ncbi:response regulator transcription factor [Chitinispirillales bacterium ANBcel5]|uniref:response regulator n=1 Tax=Cellulosispirillum alkaliphilum TaxID=3039283 RepID=UPI002A4F202A|nr:response regulator transcription factor [Chitinispirillales bacterium ANBcel5]
MTSKKILIIEDDEDIIELVSYNLAREGYDVVAAVSGEEGLEKIKREQPNLVLLDLMLPGIDGFEVCRSIRTKAVQTNIPIIMLTAKGENADIVTGLELGADDYIIKPFSPRVLLARIKNILRRKNRENTDSSSVIALDKLVIHPGRHEVLLDNKKIDLTYTEFAVLHHLASKPEWVFSRFQIVEAIKGENYPVTDRSVDVIIVGLRKKLGKFGTLIETVRGVGYRFKEQVQVCD